jgi:hypothetical protein
LTEDEAVARAEEFVRINGYCRTEDADPKRVQAEAYLTFGTTPEELLQQRAGTLLPRACGVIGDALRGFDEGWTVVFCLNPAVLREHHGADWKPSPRDQARIVVMDRYGKEVFVPHSNITFALKGIRRLPGMDDYEREGADMERPRKSYY